MSDENIRNLRPFLSLVAIIVTLFAVVFAKMEVRRKGYYALQLSKQERELKDLKHSQQIQLAQSTRPERIEKVAIREGTNSVAPGQIIQVNGERLAFRQ